MYTLYLGVLLGPVIPMSLCGEAQKARFRESLIENKTWGRGKERRDILFIDKIQLFNFLNNFSKLLFIRILNVDSKISFCIISKVEFASFA